MENDAKKELQTITQTAMEEVSEALRNGDLPYFFEHMPDKVNEIYRTIHFNKTGLHIEDESLAKSAPAERPWSLRQQVEYLAELVADLQPRLHWMS